MSNESEDFLLKWWFEAGTRWESIRVRLRDIPARWVVLLVMSGLAGYGILLRCLHLLDPEHYYMLTPDSYFFHWVAGGVMAGEPPPSLPGLDDTYLVHSGLAYPLAYIGKALGSVFNIPATQALDDVSKFLPPLIGVVTLVVLYLAGSRMCDRRVGVFSALAWSAMLYAVYTSAAGYVDRDSLSILMVMLGAIIFYMSRGWRFRIGGRDIGWLLAGLGVLALEGLLYIYWSFVGAVLLLAIVVSYFCVRLLLGYTDHLQEEPSAKRRVIAAASEVNWPTFSVIVTGNIVVLALVAILHAGQLEFWFQFLVNIFRAEGAIPIAEMSGIAPGQLLAFAFFLIPMLLSIYLAVRKRSEPLVFFSCWFICLLVLSLFAQRVLYSAVPAACLLSGAGLAFLWDWQGQGAFQTFRKLGVAALLILIVLWSFGTYYLGGSAGGLMAPNRDWQNALAYLRDDTPEEAAVMTQWSYGYWILDLGQRTPIVDNGYYHQDKQRLRDIALAYSTSDPQEAVRIMQKYGASHLIFPESDRVFSSVILGWAELDEAHDDFPRDSLFVRSLSGEFESEDGLEVVYRSSPNAEVVILRTVSPDRPSTQ